MSTKHTPGPWMIFENGDIGSAAVRTPEHTVIKSGTVKGATIGEAMANAQLIAAAPDMLQRLRDIVAAYEVGSASALEVYITDTRALIAKAVQS